MSLPSAAATLETGAAGNAAAGRIALMSPYPAGIQRCTNPAAFTGGRDREGDESLRARVLGSFRRLPNVANATTFFFLYQHIRSVPRAYYEVARIEGGNALWTLKHVTIGLCKGAISAVAILTVIESWNIYFWPLLVLSKPEARTLTIGLKQFLDFESGNRWGPFMATATLASLPVVVVYLFLQKHIIAAFVSSGIKG